MILTLEPLVFAHNNCEHVAEKEASPEMNHHIEAFHKHISFTNNNKHLSLLETVIIVFFRVIFISVTVFSIIFLFQLFFFFNFHFYFTDQTSILLLIFSKSVKMYIINKFNEQKNRLFFENYLFIMLIN